MKIRLLGGVSVLDGEQTIPIGGPKERRVLALLAINANRAVGEDSLVDAVWGDHPPRTATKTLQGYISRLRRALTAGGGFAIEAQPRGYMLVTPPGGTDVAEVDDVISSLQRAAGDPASVAELASRALALWRGPALSEFADEPFAQAEAVRLSELRLSLVEQRVQAELECGRHAALVGELEALCGAHPTRERMWAQRMLALYRSGRQAEALRAYQELRRYLQDELGLEPSPDLQRLEREVLEQDPRLDLTGPPAGARPTDVLPVGVVTFMLTDIEESTVLWDRYPDAMTAALELHERHISGAVTANGGTLIKAKGEGDSTVSVFRSPRDAAQAALSAQEEITAATWPEPLSLAVRMSIHTGEAQQREGDYFGIALNRAARLRQLARGGQILVSAVTADLIRDQLPPGAGLVDLGLHELRGIRRMERVFQLWSGHDAPQNLGVGAPPTAETAPGDLGAPFVGRDAELELLQSMLERSMAGAPQLCLLTGEAGIGKSRLLQQFGRSAAGRGARVLVGRCQQHLDVPYLPFVGALFPILGKENQQLVARLAAPDRTVPAGVERRPGEDVLLWSSLAEATLRIARQRPTVLVVEDFHWADQATVDLLSHLVMAMASASLSGAVPLLVMVTVRPDADGRRADALRRMRREELCRTVDVGGLPADDVERLARALGLRSAPRRIMAMLVEATKGNPLFVENLVAQLLADDHAFGSPTTWSPSVPAEIGDAIDQRVGRLSEACRRTLVLAAHFGRPFRAEDLSAAGAGTADDVLGALEEAAAAGLIVQAGDAFRFTHDLYARALYTRISRARRRTTHAAIARAMLSAVPASQDRQLLEVTHHVVEAGMAADPDWAFDVCRAGADQAEALAAWREAYNARAALAAMGVRMGFDAGSQAELELRAGRDAGRNLDVDAASDHLERAAHAFQAAGDLRGKATALTERARFQLVATSTGFQVDLEPLNAVLKELGDAEPALRAEILEVMAPVAFMQLDAERSEALADGAIALAEPLGDHETLSRAHAWRGIAAWQGVRLDESRERLELALHHAEQLEDGHEAKGIALTRLALVRIALGQLDGADEAARAGESHARTGGDIRNRVYAMTARLASAVARGNFADADRQFEEASDLLRFLEFHQPRWLLVLSAVTGRLQRGHWDEVSTMLERWTDTDSATVTTWGYVLSAVRGLALAYGGRGDEVRIAAAPSRLPPSLASIQYPAALADIGYLGGAGVPVEEVLGLLEEAHQRGMVLTTGLTFLVPRVLGLAEALNGRTGEARAHLEEAIVTAERIGARPELARARMDLAELIVRTAPDERAVAIEQAGQAARLFSKLGLEPFSRRAAAMATGGEAAHNGAS